MFLMVLNQTHIQNRRSPVLVWEHRESLEKNWSFVKRRNGLVRLTCSIFHCSMDYFPCRCYAISCTVHYKTLFFESFDAVDSKFDARTPEFFSDLLWLVRFNHCYLHKFNQIKEIKRALHAFVAILHYLLLQMPRLHQCTLFLAKTFISMVSTCFHAALTRWFDATSLYEK